MSRTGAFRMSWAWPLLVAWMTGLALAQGPTIEPSAPRVPGLGRSLLGPSPGEGSNPGELQEPDGGVLIGRPGPSTPRVPQSVVRPPSGMAAPTAPAIGSPPELPTTSPPVYGLLSVPDGGLDEGPPDGLTLDEAIARLIRDNLDLRARFLEIPQARADVLTASLRSNPVLYADGQLIPYGQYSPQRPGGPVQYDLNITWPLDVSHKRRARTEVAERALRVLEAQYQDAVRLSIDNLHTAFVDVLAARQTVWYARASVEGLDRILEVTEALKAQGERSAADVNRVRILRNAAQIGLVDAEATLRGTQRILATLLNFPPPHAASLDVRGTLRDLVPPPPPLDVLNQIALGQRPDLIAFRLGIARAEADVRLAEANRLSDVFLLYQPFTYQDNSPFNAQSATSWALGVTVPLPLFNRNQGNIQRAVINVAQTRLELEALEHQVLTEVEQALREYEVSRSAVARIETDLLPTARQVRNDTFQLFTGGGAPVMDYLNAQRDYNELVRQYRDTLARHRRSMLSLNTALGLRLLP